MGMASEIAEAAIEAYQWAHFRAHLRAGETIGFVGGWYRIHKASGSLESVRSDELARRTKDLDEVAAECGRPESWNRGQYPDAVEIELLEAAASGPRLG